MAEAAPRVAEAAPRVQAPVEAPPQPVQEAGELPKKEKPPIWANIPCPECGQTDALRKHSVAYAEDALQHPLKRRDGALAPPKKPKYMGLGERVEKVVSPIVAGTFEHVGCLTGGFVYFVLLLTPLMIWGVFTAWLAMTLTGNTFDMEASVPRAAGILWMLLFVIPPVVFVYREWKKSKAFMAREEPLWRDTVAEWSSRFHCERCDHAFTSDVPIPMGLGGAGGRVEEGVGSEDTSLIAKVLTLFVGVATHGKCDACAGEMDGIRFSYIDYRRLPTSVRQNVGQSGYVCTECGTIHCLACAGAALNINDWSGFTDAVCPNCGAPMSTPDHIILTSSWYDTIQAALEEASGEAETN